MRDYEMMIIISPNVDERNLNQDMDKLLQIVPNEGGTLKKVDIWGRRKLAYPIQKHEEAFYVVVDMFATSETAQELDRVLTLNENVLRTKLLRKDEK